ncbi:MAG: hypothetical protein LBJ73_05445 [Rickettsiales bacterium]|jgi:hypothetical protein|nr:hypothetical protein [Rickettsiales bacterium]
MKQAYKICLSLFFSFVTYAAHADIASVEYVHNTISAVKNINVPVADAVDTNNVCSIRYLYEQIDKANQILNGAQTTNYADSIGAFSNNVVSSIRAQSDIQSLISCSTYYCWVQFPPTINLAGCVYNTPYAGLRNAVSCLGTNDTVGHWELVSSYTAGIGRDRYDTIKKAGQVPAGLYRVETFGTDLEIDKLGTSIILTNRTMYYGHASRLSELTSRLYLSVMNSFTVGQLVERYGQYCNWNFSEYNDESASCYLGNTKTRLSLDSNDGTVDTMLGHITPGISEDNTETPMQTSAIYRWVNN